VYNIITPRKREYSYLIFLLHIYKTDILLISRIL